MNIASQWAETGTNMSRITYWMITFQIVGNQSGYITVSMEERTVNSSRRVDLKKKREATLISTYNWWYYDWVTRIMQVQFYFILPSFK